MSQFTRRIPSSTPPDAPIRRPSASRGPARPTLRRGSVAVSAEAAYRARIGHPWIYRDALGNRDLRRRAGEVLEVRDPEGGFVAWALCDPDSPMVLRVLSRDPERSPALPNGAASVATEEGAAPTPAVRGDYLVECVANARARRLPLLPTEEELDAYRVLSGETEGVPGVTVDRFGAYLVVHLFTPAALTLREPLLDALEQVWRPTGIYEQRRFRPLGGDAPRDPSVLARGAHAPVEVEVREHGARFGVDVTAPLSPGLFPDLRLGRLAVRALARGKRVLNLFSFTGPFTVHALQGGASRVTAVDLSSKAQARARRNLELSGLDREAAELINGDAFKVLHQMKARNRQFDLIVADPPAFASAKDRVFSAVRDYRDLADACCQVLAPGGLLAYASAAAKLTTEELDRSVAEGASRAQLSLQVVQRVGFPPDFPVAPGFPEGNYLKFAIAARPLRSVG